MGLVTGPHTRTPCTHSKWLVGPGRTPERTRGRGAHSTWPASPGCPPRGRAAVGGGGPDPGRPSQRQTAPPSGTPYRHPVGAQRRPARACAEGHAQSPRPHRPHPGHTGRRTLAARPRGQAARAGTAPDTRRPSQRWQATPPGDNPPPPPRHAAPTGHAGQGDSVGPPHPHTRAHSTWVADPDSPPSGRAVVGGERLTSDTPHNGGRPPPRGTTPHHPRGTQPPQGMQAKGTVLGPHTHTPAPTARGWRTPTARPVGGQSGEGSA